MQISIKELRYSVPVLIEVREEERAHCVHVRLFPDPVSQTTEDEISFPTGSPIGLIDEKSSRSMVTRFISEDKSEF